MSEISRQTEQAEEKKQEQEKGNEEENGEEEEGAQKEPGLSKAQRRGLEGLFKTRIGGFILSAESEVDAVRNRAQEARFAHGAGGEGRGETAAAKEDGSLR